MSMPVYDFSGKVALVTGAAGGIGRAAALRFAQSGAAVLIADRDGERGPAVVSEIQSAGGTAAFKQVDVSSSEDCDALISACLEWFGGLDYAFNNAGIGARLAPIDEFSPEIWQKTLNINLTGVFNCVRSEVAVMRRAGRGAIVNNASVMGLVGALHGSAYTAAKHGVIGLTRATALDCRDAGIRINAVCPGFTETAMTGQGGDKKYESVAAAVRRTPMGRMAQPGEIAEAALWLCSDGSSFVTGSALVVDGGFTTA